MKYRSPSIDAMRTVAIIFMILCHFTISLSNPDSNYQWFHLLGNHIVGDFAAPLFLFLVGYCLSLKNYMTPQYFLKRGSLTILIGLAFSLLIWGPGYLFAWDILPAIGASIIICGILHKTPPLALLLLLVALPIVAPFLRSPEYYNMWGKGSKDVFSFFPLLEGWLIEPRGEYIPQFKIKHVMNGFLFHGYFPLFPWLFFPLLGMWTQKSKNFLLKKGVGYLLGISLFVSSFGLAFFSKIQGTPEPVTHIFAPFSFYPLTLPLLLLQASFCLLLWQWFTLREQSQKSFPKWVHVWGAQSLRLYWLHHIIIIYSLYIIGYLKTGDVWIFFTRSTTPLIAFSLGAMFLLIYHVIFVRKKALVR